MPAQFHIVEFFEYTVLHPTHAHVFKFSSRVYCRSFTMPSIYLVIFILIYCQLSESIKVEDYVEAFKPVMIDDTTYSMVELPGSETKLVVDERNKLLGHIDLRSLVHDLGYVGRCIQLAYHGMAVAGQDPEYVKLQIEVQRLGYDVTRLCDKWADTVSKFRRESTAILTDLQATYEYLVEGSEDHALETLSSVSNIAGQFAKTAEELHNSFDEKAHIVEQIMEKTWEMEADNEHTAAQTEMNKKDQEIIKGRLMQQYRKVQEEIKKAEQNYFESELEEKQAIENLNFEDGGLIQNIMGFISQQSREKNYQVSKKNRMDAQIVLMEKREKAEQTYQRMTELIVEIQHLFNG